MDAYVDNQLWNYSLISMPNEKKCYRHRLCKAQDAEISSIYRDWSIRAREPIFFTAI